MALEVVRRPPSGPCRRARRRRALPTRRAGGRTGRARGSSEPHVRITRSRRPVPSCSAQCSFSRTPAERAHVISDPGPSPATREVRTWRRRSSARTASTSTRSPAGSARTAARTRPTTSRAGLFAGEVGTPRLLKLFERNDLKTTWFIPGHSIETFPEQIEQVVAAGHEIGMHGYTHENPIAMTREQETAVLDKCIELIEQVSGSGRPATSRPGGSSRTSRTSSCSSAASSTTTR